MPLFLVGAAVAGTHAQQRVDARQCAIVILQIASGDREHVMHVGRVPRLEFLVGQLKQRRLGVIEAGRLNQFFGNNQSISRRTVRQLRQLSLHQKS